MGSLFCAKDETVKIEAVSNMIAFVKWFVFVISIPFIAPLQIGQLN
tara:strand:- start:15 stop:152 length:138 start_codon:yes stop_codon:yes gene_type:complete